jgi:Zn finger protein HypA/HybF involved in hydrogenase expression
LIFNFKLLSKNTSAENAELNIEKVSGDDWKLVSMEGGE